MKNMTLTNNFHNTEVTVRVPNCISSETEAWNWICKERERRSGYLFWVAYRRYNRVKKELCGITGCCCGIVRPIHQEIV